MYYSDEEHFKSFNGYEINGTWYPRVTKIVDIKAKPALYRFYAEALNFKAGQEISEKSAKEGTLVHETVEQILIGKKPEIDPSIAPAIDAFVKFLDQNNVQVDPEFVERKIINLDHRYAGTIDTLALIDGKFGVLDIKTSQAIYRDYNLQTAAYADALSKEFDNFQTRWILRIDQIKTCSVCNSTLRLKGGREKIKTPPKKSGQLPCLDGQHQWLELQGVIELKEFPFWKDDFQAFLGAKKLWEREDDYLLSNVGYIR